MGGYLDPVIPSLPFSEATTSKDAAEAIKPTAAKQRERYFAWLWLRGRVGGTDREAECIMRRSSICARRNELVAMGRVEKTELRRDRCAVYVTVPR